MPRFSRRATEPGRRRGSPTRGRTPPGCRPQSRAVRIPRCAYEQPRVVDDARHGALDGRGFVAEVRRSPVRRASRYLGRHDLHGEREDVHRCCGVGLRREPDAVDAAEHVVGSCPPPVVGERHGHAGRSRGLRVCQRGFALPRRTAERRQRAPQEVPKRWESEPESPPEWGSPSPTETESAWSPWSGFRRSRRWRSRHRTRRRSARAPARPPRCGCRARRPAGSAAFPPGGCRASRSALAESARRHSCP